MDIRNKNSRKPVFRFRLLGERNFAKVSGRLKDVLEPLCEPYVPAIKQHLENVQTQKLFITPAAQPRVSRVPHDDKVYNIIVRFASPVAKRLEIQQAVLDEFLRTQCQLINKLK